MTYKFIKSASPALEMIAYVKASGLDTHKMMNRGILTVVADGEYLHKFKGMSPSKCFFKAGDTILYPVEIELFIRVGPFAGLLPNTKHTKDYFAMESGTYVVSSEMLTCVTTGEHELVSTERKFWQFWKPKYKLRNKFQLVRVKCGSKLVTLRQGDIVTSEFPPMRTKI